MKKQTEKFDVYKMITDRMLEAIERDGALPWVKPWDTVKGVNQCNGVSGRPYSGINMFLLSMTDFESNYWYSFKQLQEAGGKLKEGARATQVVFWKRLKVTEKDEQTGAMEAKVIPLLRYYNVFNLDQIEGITPKQFTVPNPEAKPIELCENIVQDYVERCGLFQLQTKVSDRAFYAPALDLVQVPKIEQFKTVEQYYSVLFHELGHSTGHKSRLNRKEIVNGTMFGDMDYSLEELVAELTAAFVCAEAGISNETTERSSKAYLKNWYEALKGDRKMFVTASARASKSANLILNKQFVEQED